MPADMIPQGGPGEFAGPGHETSDITVRGVLVFAVGLVGLSALVMVALGALMTLYTSREARLEASRPGRYADRSGLYPVPNLQDDPTDDMVRLRADEASSLADYGWADRQAGVARLPIDRAMDLVARRGLPVRKAGEAAAPKAKPDEIGKDSK